MGKMSKGQPYNCRYANHITSLIVSAMKRHVMHTKMEKGFDDK